MSDNRTDLPSPDASNFGQRVRETLMTYLGRQGDPLDKGLTARDMASAGIIAVKTGFKPGGTSVTNTVYTPGAALTYTADLSMPPTPTGFTATAAISNIVVGHDSPHFTQGHGYLRTRLYGATWVSGALPVFSGATRISDFSGTTSSYATNPSTTWRLWITWESVDGIESSPAGGVNGLAVTTGADVSTLITALTGHITSSQLDSTLTSRVNLIDGPSSLTGSVAAQLLTEANARASAITAETAARSADILAEATARGTAITNESSLRVSGYNTLATSISLITAGVAGGFDVGQAWYFDASAEGWTSVNATETWAAGFVDIAASGSNPQFIGPTISITGASYHVIQARIKRLAGSGWDGTAYYTTSGHGFSGSYKKTIAAPSVFGVGDVAIVTWDMTSLTAGGTDWSSNTITQIRLDIGLTSADDITVDWVGIGRFAPGASQAGLLSEQTARTTADTALASSITALTATVTANDATATASIASESSTRASADSAISSIVTALTSTVTTNYSTATAAIASEATTRSTADSALSSTLSSLTATVTSNNTTLTGSITSEASTRASADSVLTSAVSALTSTVDYNNTTITSALTTEESTRSSADSAMATDITTLYATTGSHTASIASEAIARATADSSLASSISTLTASSAANAAAISTEASTRSSADSAAAALITTLQSTVNDPTTGLAANYTAISTEASTRATQTGNLFAQYTVKIDTNGYVTGYGLASTLTGATPTSSFAVRADEFYIANPTGPSISPSMPFIVRTTGTTIGGVAVPAGVYITDAFIQNGTIDNAKIANLAVDNAKIASVAVDKMTAGTISTGQYINSSNYVSGSSGFSIQATGYAEFNNIVVRGTVYASAGAFSGDITGSNGHFTGYITGGAISGWSWPTAGSGPGFYLGPNGLLLGNYNDGKYLEVDSSGDIHAPGLSIISGSAVFSGALSAATGSFAGSLSAATGTFTGTLTAAAVNAVDTINIAGAALVVPVGSTGSSGIGSIYWPGGLYGSYVSTYSVEQTLTSATLNFSNASTGNSVSIFVTTNLCLAWNAVTLDYSVIRIYRNGTLIYSEDVSFGISPGWGGSAVTYEYAKSMFMFLDNNPGAGTHVYTVKWYAQETNGGPIMYMQQLWKPTQLLVIGSKK